MTQPTAPNPGPAETLLDLIEREVRCVALSFGVSAADALAAALLDRLTLRLGSSQMYLPRTDPRKRAQRNAAIRAAFNGRNIAELARQHGISPRRVRQIVERP